MNAFEPVATCAGIAVPSLLVVLVIRRWFERVPWRVAAFCLALVLAFTARAVFTRDMPVPLDEVVRGYPYRGLFGEVHSKNYLTNDTVKQILPWMQTVREDFARGRAPLWNPYLFCGYPLLGNGQSAPFSPFFLATLFVPLPKQMVAMAGLKLFVALLFGYLMTRREAVGDAAALLGSGIFAFAIFNNAFLYYPMTAVTLLLPAAGYATVVCLERASRSALILLTMVVAALLAGGHPESVVHVVLAVVAIVVIEWFAPTRRRWGRRDLLRTALAAILGVFIAAPAWVPVFEQVLVSLRLLNIHNTPGAAEVGFPRTALWAMLNPDGFGNPAHGNWNWIGSYTHVASLYLGLIPTILLPAACLSTRAERRDRLLAAAAIIFFVVSMNWTWLGWLFNAKPPLSWIAHDRLRFVVAFFVGLIVARTVHRLAGERLAWSLLATTIVFPLSAYVFIKLFGRTLTWWSLTGLVALSLFWILFLIDRQRAPLFACFLTIAELFVFTFDYNAMTDRRYYAPRLPIIEVLRQRHVQEPFRILGRDWVFLPNAAEQYGLEDVRGSDPMEWAEYVKFFRIAAVEDTSIDVKRIVDLSLPAIDFMNVRFLLTEPASNLGGKWRTLYSGVDGELYENTMALPRFFVPQVVQRVESAWDGALRGISNFSEIAVMRGDALPTRVLNPKGTRIAAREDGPMKFKLRVEATARALIASSQPAMRWWTVEVNGRASDVIIVNGAFIGFWVPKGSSQVVVRYRPWPYYTAVIVCFLSLATLVLVSRLVGSCSAPRKASTGHREITPSDDSRQ